MACVCRTRIPKLQSVVNLRHGLRSLSGTSVALAENTSDDGQDKSVPVQTATTTAAGGGAASHRPQTTRGPRRKKVGEAVQERKYFSPEFMPSFGRRSKLKDYLERRDCFSRRKVLDVPEFYPGSILAVTVSDPYAPGKESRFVGICIERKNFGLGASFKLRNCIDEQGVEINYETYNPLITKIEVLKLEKRLDFHLLYLRDALPEYSTIDPDMTAIKHPPNRPVPVNDMKVKMKPKPWHKRWERFYLHGMDMSEVLPQEKIDEGKTWRTPEYKRLDLLELYRPSSHSNEDRVKIKEEFDKHVQDLKRVKKSSAS